MTVTPTTVDVPLDTYAGKRVKVVYTPSGETTPVELVGEVAAANPQAILLRPKGRTMGVIIDAPYIESIALDAEKPPEIKPKTLKDPTLSSVRGHLADRHGWSLTDVNDPEFDEESAFKAHLDIDHQGISHTHEYIVDAEKGADGEPSDDVDESGDVEDEDDDEDGIDSEN